VNADDLEMIDHAADLVMVLSREIVRKWNEEVLQEMRGNQKMEQHWHVEGMDWDLVKAADQKDTSKSVTPSQVVSKCCKAPVFKDVGGSGHICQKCWLTAKLIAIPEGS